MVALPGVNAVGSRGPTSIRGPRKVEHIKLHSFLVCQPVYFPTRAAR